MIDLRASLEPLTDERLDEAEHSDRNNMNFLDAVRKVRTLRRLGQAFAQEYVDELPTHVVDQIQAKYQLLPPIVERMIAFDVDSEQAASLRNGIIQDVQQVHDTVLSQYRPLLRGGVTPAALIEQLSAEAERLAKLRAEMDETHERAQRLVGEAESLAADIAASNLSKFYDEQVTTHKNAGRNFLVAAGVLAGALAIGAFFLFKSLSESDDAAWSAYARDLGVRVFILGLGLYVIGFLTKGYRANQHLRVVNQQKANAVKTFRLFQASADEDSTTRDLITTELVKAVFTADESGFLDNAPDKTVVEGQSALVALLARQQQ